MIKGIRTPVRRDDAAYYIFLMLAAFAISVVGTRIYLEATGYPQIGGGDLHIAHVLWGGLAMFIGSLVPLVFVNRWAYRLGAILGGVGVGFFIDEVGKFITSTNNYFYPLAAPIIYATFLITLIIFVRARQPIQPNPRVELYHALDGLREILDRDLNAREKGALEGRLTYVQEHATDPSERELAGALMTFLHSQNLQTLPDRRGLWGTFTMFWLKIEHRVLMRRRFRDLIILLLGFSGLGALVAAIAIVRSVAAPTLDDFARALYTSISNIAGAASLSWAVTWIILHVLCGVILLLGMTLIIVGRDAIGTRLGFFGMLIAVTVVDLITFYFNQFAAVGITAFHFAVLLLILRYRASYLTSRMAAQGVL